MLDIGYCSMQWEYISETEKIFQLKKVYILKEAERRYKINKNYIIYSIF